MEKKKEIKITVRFPAEVIEALRTLAQQEDRSLNGEIVQAVREYIIKRKGGADDA
ncbi:MAG: Arc family DNA-binding protein [Chloroflexi bacterium]|nr:MAG: Arc family DNA-binding protein [Chloroflexota bacterium]